MFKLYRVENPVSKQGLWYKEDGTFNPFIKTLDNAVSRDLPMDFDPQFKEEGLDWISACDNRADIDLWFSKSDQVALKKLGYNLYQFNVSRYREINGHQAFAKEHVISVVQLDL